MRIFTPRRWRLRRFDDQGAATVEFVFLGILVLVPLLYAVIAIFDVQRNAFATTRAAREAGRAVATAEDVFTGVEIAQYAVQLALDDQGVKETARLSFIPAGEKCNGNAPAAPDPGAASLDPGAKFAVCVKLSFRIPGVPTFFDAGRNTISAKYVVQVDKFRAGKGTKGTSAKGGTGG